MTFLTGILNFYVQDIDLDLKFQERKRLCSFFNIIKGMNMENKLFKKFMTYFYGSGIALIIGLLTTIISTRILSPEDFGKASMFTLAINISMLFIVFGTDQAFIRFFYEEVNDLRTKLLFNTMKFPIILLSIVILSLFVFRKSIMLFLFDTNSNMIFFVLIFSITFQVIYRFSLLVIRMQQKGYLFSLMQVLYKVANITFLLLFFYLIGDKYEVLIYSIGVSLLIVVIISIFMERSFWLRKPHLGGETKHTQLEILKYSYPLVLTLLLTWLFQAFDKIAIRQWSNFDELGLYTAAFQIVALLSVVQGAFSTFWAPVCYEKFEKDPEDRNFFALTSRLVSLIMFAIAILTIIFKDLIVMLLGNDFEAAAQIMPFLVFIPLMYTISETTAIGINFFKKTKWHILISLTVCIINIIGNVLLVPRYGASGAAISTGISYIIFFILRTHISLAYFKVNYALKRIYFFVICIGAFAFQNLIIPNHYTTYLTGISLLGLIGILYKNDLKKLILLFLKDRNKINSN